VPTAWAVGTWASPYNLSTHNPANVSFVDDVAVLSMTSDNATGYTGTPPASDGGVSDAGGTSGSGQAGSTGQAGGSSGCSCDVGSPNGGASAAGVLLLLAAMVRARLRPGKRP
jgi:endo-1,3-1,4-beta-glycanase ExoK